MSLMHTKDDSEERTRHGVRNGPYVITVAFISLLFVLLGSWVLATADEWGELRPSTHPPPSADVDLTYDPTRDRVYALVRPDLAGLQVWEYDGINWTQHSVSNPIAADNNGRSAVYFPPTDKIVLFGYPGHDVLGRKTYEYSLSTYSWTTRDIPGPPARG
jgi:hypothetical protein